MPYALIRITEHDRELLEKHSIVRIRRQFADLARKFCGHPVLLYQSVRQPGRAQISVGFFATAYLEDVLPETADNAFSSIFLGGARSIHRGFEQDHETGDLERLSPGWNASADVQEISADLFHKMAGQDTQASFVRTEPAQGVLVPRFRTRRQEVRDPKFQERVYRAYRGQCAISGITLLNPDGTCGLEAAHIVPHSTSPHHLASAGLLLAPTWHSRFDGGAIIVNDDYSWSARVDDRDTQQIAHRRLLLPLFRSDWPELTLLKRKRELLRCP